MYKTIYVPVDNSDYSNQAVDSAIALGQAFDSQLVGCHVYAAQMHDYRFKQMEYTLPEARARFRSSGKRSMPVRNPPKCASQLIRPGTPIMLAKPEKA